MKRYRCVSVAIAVGAAALLAGCVAPGPYYTGASYPYYVDPGPVVVAPSLYIGGYSGWGGYGGYYGRPGYYGGYRPYPGWAGGYYGNYGRSGYYGHPGYYGRPGGYGRPGYYGRR